MKPNSLIQPARWKYFTSIGILLFVALYICAALLYPGGSQQDKHAAGFSWMHNYWCNLLAEKGLNGSINPGRPIAMTAMFILCITLLVYWYWFFEDCRFFRHAVKRIYQWSAFLSMFVCVLIFTRLHDQVILLGGFFGLIVLLGMQLVLYRKRQYFLFAFGLVNCLLIVLNNYLFYGNHFYYLPLVQKISFASFLLWLMLVSLFVNQYLQTDRRLA